MLKILNFFVTFFFLFKFVYAIGSIILIAIAMLVFNASIVTVLLIAVGWFIATFILVAVLVATGHAKASITPITDVDEMRKRGDGWEI